MKQEGDGITCMILFARVSVGASFMLMSYCTAARFSTWETAGFQVFSLVEYTLALMEKSLCHHCDHITRPVFLNRGL